MNRRWPSVIALALAATPLAATPLVVWAQQPAPHGDAARGRALFSDFKCYACHGSRGSNGNGGPIAGAALFAYPAFLRQVRVPRRQMPAYPAQELPDEGVADIHAYLASIPPSPDVKTIPMLNR